LVRFAAQARPRASPWNPLVGWGEGGALRGPVLDVGADGPAMGAYHGGRTVERILGGATEHVLQHATLLLLMH